MTESTNSCVSSDSTNSDVPLVPVWDQHPQLSWSDKVALLTYKFMQLEQTGTGLEHIFEEGKYIREVKIPAGTLIVGRIHKVGHITQLLEGSVLLIGPDGFRMGVQAPYEIKTGPGFQMVCFTLSNIVARTVHPNPDDLRDIDILETQIFESPVELIRRGEQIERSLTCQP